MIIYEYKPVQLSALFSCTFTCRVQIEHKWKLLADLAVKKSEFEIAADALQAAQDENALLLLASATGNRQLAQSVAERAFNEKRANTAFLAYFMLGEWVLISRSLNILYEYIMLQ